MRNLWLFCVMGGVLAGTIWANLLSGELLGQVGYFDGIYRAKRADNGREQWRLWRYIVRQRLWEVGLGGLVAMTPVAVFGYLIGAFGAGFGLAALISLFTLEKGWLGIGCWLLSVLPQGVCYVGGWMLLVMTVIEGRSLKKLRVGLTVGILMAVGSALETWVNPMLWKWF